MTNQATLDSWKYVYTSLVELGKLCGKAEEEKLAAMFAKSNNAPSTEMLVLRKDQLYLMSSKSSDLSSLQALRRSTSASDAMSSSIESDQANLR